MVPNGNPNPLKPSQAHQLIFYPLKRHLNLHSNPKATSSQPPNPTTNQITTDQVQILNPDAYKSQSENQHLEK